jgi:hypothetical protein
VFFIDRAWIRQLVGSSECHSEAALLKNCSSCFHFEPMGGHRCSAAGRPGSETMFVKLDLVGEVRNQVFR